MAARRRQPAKCVNEAAGAAAAGRTDRRSTGPTVRREAACQHIRAAWRHQQGRQPEEGLEGVVEGKGGRALRAVVETMVYDAGISDFRDSIHGVCAVWSPVLHVSRGDGHHLALTSQTSARSSKYGGGVGDRGGAGTGSVADARRDMHEETLASLRKSRTTLAETTAIGEATAEELARQGEGSLFVSRALSPRVLDVGAGPGWRH